jgi:long-chain acyl-CoA synthetase
MEISTIREAVAQPTLCAAFQLTARGNRGLPALRLAGSEQVVTWDEYERRVRAIATGLHAIGVRAGDPVALLLRNRPEFHMVDAAVLHLGATPFSLYHTEPVEQLLRLVEDSGVRVIVTESAFADRAAAVLAQARRVERLVVDGGAAADDRVLSLVELEQLGDADFDFDATWRAVGPETIATLVYTSGTTGAPKAVQIPRRAIMHSLAGVERLAPATPSQRCVSFLPNAHISDRFMCHYSVIGLGGSVTCVPDHEALWDTLREVRPTRFHGVPRTFEKLADAARAQIDADPALRVALADALVGVRAQQPGAPLGAGDAARAAAASEALRPVRERLGLDPVEWLSVAAAPSSYAVLELHHALGLDLAAVDEDGYIRIVGRKKEQMINSSGKNLFPAKIESAVKEGAPLLAHVAVIADGRPYVAALIVLDALELQALAAARGRHGTRAELIAEPWVRAEVERAVAAGNERLSRVEQVRAWAILDADWQPGGPELTNTLKLRRSAIDERYADVIASLDA